MRNSATRLESDQPHFRLQLQEAQQQHGDQRRPNLDLDGVGRGTDEGLDLQILFQGLEEQLSGKGLARYLGVSPARFQPLPIGTAREVFPQAARPCGIRRKGYESSRSWR